MRQWNVVAWLWILVVLVAVAAVRAGDEVWIQALLERTAHVQLETGTYRLDAPLRIGPRMRLEGRGAGTLLDYKGAEAHGPYAVLYGQTDSFNYRSYVAALTIRGGGVWCQRFGPIGDLRELVLYDAPAAGILVEGPGAGFTIRDCDVQNCDQGYVFRTRWSSNGLSMEGCHAAGNRREGLVVEAVDSVHAYFANWQARRCTIQGNNVSNPGGAEIVLRGNLTNPVLDNVHAETTTNRSAVGVLVEGQAFAMGSQTLTRYPVGVRMVNGCAVEGGGLTWSIDVVNSDVAVSDSRLRKAIRRAAACPDPVLTGFYVPDVVRAEVVVDVAPTPVDPPPETKPATAASGQPP